MLEKYSKADLKRIVEIYNLGIDEKTLKKKKAELAKEMVKVGKKNLNEDDIDRKLSKKETNTSEKKGTHKMPDGTLMTGKTHTKDSKPVKDKKKPKLKIVKKLPEKKEEKPKRKFKLKIKK